MENCKWHLEINGQHCMILKYEKKKLDSAILFCFVVRKYMSDNILDIFLQTGKWMDQFSSDPQSYLTLRPHESQHAGPRCPSPTPGVYANKCPLSQWCHPAISSSVIPFSSCPWSNCQHPLDHRKSKSSRKTSISALLTMPNPLTVWITTNCGKFWKRWKYQTTWPVSWETCMQVRKQQLELDMEQQTGSK